MRAGVGARQPGSYNKALSTSGKFLFRFAGPLVYSSAPPPETGNKALQKSSRLPVRGVP
jgi:hypothetical protein